MVISEDIKTIAETIRKAVPAEKIYLFGSYAYGTPHKDSDYDFYIIIPDGVMRPIEAMQKAQQAIYTLGIHMPVDVLANYKSEFEELKDLITLERTINRRGVLLYDQS